MKKVNFNQMDSKVKKTQAKNPPLNVNEGAMKIRS